MNKNVLVLFLLGIMLLLPNTGRSQSPPTITSFSPVSGPLGTSVVITGTHFNTTPSSNIVRFGAVKAPVSAATSTTLTVTVPAGTTYSPISVTTGNLSAFSRIPFDVTFGSGGALDSLSFSPSVSFNVGVFPAAGLVIGDLDGDGKADVVVGNGGDGTISLFRNISTPGSLTTLSLDDSVDLSSGIQPYDLKLGDVDGDGKLDIVVLDRGFNTGNLFSILLNTSTPGNLSFANKIDFTTPTNPFSFVLSDLDNDGKIDIVIASNGTVSGGNPEGDSIAIYRNTSTPGSLSLATATYRTGCVGLTCVNAGDLNGDGKPDLVAIWSSCSRVSVLENTTVGSSITFAPSVDFTESGIPYTGALGDMNGDGKLDMVVEDYLNNNVAVFQNQNAGGAITSASFASPVTFPVDLAPRTIALGDLNGDGKADILAENHDSNIASILRNTSSGGTITFAPKLDTPTGNVPLGVAIGDIDGDGKPDWGVVNNGNFTISFHRNRLGDNQTTLAAPVLFSPANGTVNQSSPLTFRWHPSAGAASYRFQLATDSLFTSKVVDDSTLTDTTRPVSVLLGLTKYYWRVNAKDFSGTSPFSLVWNMTTSPLPPAPPSLLSPASAATNQPSSITFRWNSSLTATSYRFQLASDTLFATKIVDDSTLTDTTRPVSGLSLSTVYYWRVNAKNSVGVSAFSSFRRFSTTDLIAPTVSISAPANHSIVSNTIAVSANAADNISVAGVQFRLDGIALGAEDTTAPYSTSWNTIPVSNGLHLLTAVARDVAGNSTTSSPDSVTVSNVVSSSDLWIYQEALTSPWIDASWASTVTYNSTQQSFTPPNSVKCVTGAFGGFRVRSAQWGTTVNINPAIYSRLEFLIYNTTATLSLNIAFSNEAGGVFSTVTYNNIPLNQWTTVSYPMAQMNPGNVSIQYLTMQSNTAAAGTFYVDNLRLVGLQSVPPVVVLTSPANGAVNQPTNLTFRWSPSSGATSYRFQLATDTLFTAKIVDDSTITDTTRLVSSLSNSTKYFWRVNAKNSLGTSSFSQAWSMTTTPPTPIAPLLFSPANGVINQPSSLTMRWHPSAGAASYRFQLATDSLFTAKVVDDSTLTDTTRPVSSLLNLTKYFWRVNAKNVSGTSSFSLVWNMTTSPLPPAPPSLLSPANAAANQPLSLTFRWNSSSSATSYRLQLASDTLFTTNIVDDSTLTDTTRPVSGLLANSFYYWRVNAKNSVGASAFSSFRRFSTLDLIFPTVSITAPANGAVVSNTIAVTANASDNIGVVGVQFRLDGIALGAEDTTAPYSISWNTIPVSNGLHILTAVARDAAGNTTTSLVDSVNVSNIASSSDLWIYQETLTSPWIDVSWASTVTYNSTQQSFTPPNSIKCVTGAFGGFKVRSAQWGTTVNINPAIYSRLEFLIYNTTAGLSLNISFSNDAGGVFTTVTYPNVPTNQWTTVSYPMAQMNPGNVSIQYLTMQSNTAAAGTFYLDNLRLVGLQSVPPVVVLTSPSNGAVNQPTNLTFRWSPSSGATSYRFQLATDTLFTAKIVDDSTITDTTRLVSSLSNSTKYFWRVNAKNSLGTSSFSQAWSMTTTSPTPIAPLLFSPANGVISQPSSLTMRWHPSAGAASYRFQLATDSLFVSKVVDDSTITDTTRPVSSLLNLTKYFWRVNAKNVSGTSSFSLVWNMTTSPLPPAPPLLLSPANAASNQPLSLTFGWNASSTATSYRFQLATDSLFTAKVVDDSTLTDTTRPVSGLLANSFYYWRVNAKNSVGVSAFSLFRRFSTLDLIVPTVSITAPANGAVVSNTISVTANAADNIGVAGVQFRLDGIALGAEDTTAPYSVSWNTSSVPNSLHLLTAVARDAAGNATTSLVDSVNVSNIASSADLWIYQETLTSPWIDASWAGTYTYNSTQQSFTAPNSVKCVASAWGGFKVRSSQWGTTANINPALYASVEFKVYNTTAGLTLFTAFSNDAGGSFGSGVYNNVPVNQWITITYPMSQLDPNNLSIQYLSIANITGSTQTFFIDDVRLVGVSAGAGTTPLASGPDVSATSPTRFELGNNFPNPFNPVTTIGYSVPADAHLTLKVYDVTGREVELLVDDRRQAGTYNVKWDAAKFSSGTYFARLEAMNEQGGLIFVQVKRLMLIK